MTLEASVVFLWGIDGVLLERNREQFYVGMSRAKSLLYLWGRSETCRAILEVKPSV